MPNALTDALLASGAVTGSNNGLADNVAQAMQQTADATGPDSEQYGRRLWQIAQARYPVLKRAGIQYMYQPKDVPRAGKLEFYPAGESLRPSGMDINQPGVAVFDPRTRPIDLLGDYVSHMGRMSDPVLKQHYDAFVSGLTDRQKQKLVADYEYAKTEASKNGGEVMPFEQWVQMDRLPAFYRGYVFDQWPADFTSQLYSPEQLKQLDEIRPYLNLPPRQ